jgi:glyoxylase-like metal-dependent hydrolase (beta-lactamase superfamily II)
MFRGLGEWVARQLEGVELASPDLLYDGLYDLDLGGRMVQLRPTGRAHTKGDQVVTVPDAGVIFSRSSWPMSATTWISCARKPGGGETPG